MKCRLNLLVLKLRDSERRSSTKTSPEATDPKEPADLFWHLTDEVSHGVVLVETQDGIIVWPL